MKPATDAAQNATQAAATGQEIASELGFGMVPNIFATATPNPEAQTALWQAFRHTILRGVLPRTAKEMMGIIISREAKSSYAASVHIHALTLQGIETPILEALSRGETPAGLPGKLRTLMDFAAAAARTPNDPGLAERLRGAGFDEAEVIEAVTVVGVFRMVNAWTDLMAIPVDDL